MASGVPTSGKTRAAWWPDGMNHKANGDRTSPPHSLLFREKPCALRRLASWLLTTRSSVSPSQHVPQTPFAHWLSQGRERGCPAYARGGPGGRTVLRPRGHAYEYGSQCRRWRPAEPFEGPLGRPSAGTALRERSGPLPLRFTAQRLSATGRAPIER